MERNKRVTGKMIKKNDLGILYFWIHFLIEVTSFYIVSSYTDQNGVIWGIALLYDYFAFVPQGFYGYFSDKGWKINFAPLGIAFAAVALILKVLGTSPYLLVFLLALGNGMLHVHGAEVTLRTSEGRMFPSALFVSGGSFGVITGKLLAIWQVSPYWILSLLIVALALIFCAEIRKKRKGENAGEPLRLFRFHNPRRTVVCVLVLATLVVAIRAYMGYGIPTTWNKTMGQTVMLYVAMGIGKGLGGYCIDRFGIRMVAWVSTLGALPFLLLGDRLMMVSLIGILLFSMTMAITLGLMVSALPALPGVAFGLTTFGLFAGSLPIFFFRIKSFPVNCGVVLVLTILSLGILLWICGKPENTKGERTIRMGCGRKAQMQK